MTLPRLLPRIFFLLAMVGCSSGADSPTACQALASCCASLSAPAATCTAQASAASAAGDGACTDVLASYVSSGLCGGPGKVVSDTGLTFDAGAPPDAAPSGEAICSRYLTCVGSIEPSELPTSLAAYGPSGACWSDGESAKETCITACTEGVASLHTTSATGCPLCTADSDCGGEVCSATKGACVQCTSDAQCGASHCDLGTNECVACVVDSDCKESGAPHCGTTGSCVGCTAGFQCSSGTCNQDQTCCVPTSCAKGYPGLTCGMVDDGCGGMVSCGTCSEGYCDEGSDTCSSVGLPCTSGGDPSQCGNGTVCAYDSWHQAYDCSPSVEGQACMTYPTDTCSGGLSYMSGPVDDYTCVGPDGGNGTCGKNCLVNADCATGQTCVPWDDNAITAQLPGQCQPPM